MNARGFRWVLLVGFISLFSHSAIAQFTTTGELFGNVTGVDDEPVTGAVVILKSDRAITTLTSITDAKGVYRVSNIPPASYHLTITSEDNGSIGPLRVTVRAGSGQRLDYRLTLLRAIHEEISVEADAPQIETTRSETNKYISSEAIQNLPLQNRSFLDILMTVPGVHSADAALTPGSPRNSFHVHGARANQNNFLIDGAPNNDRSDLNSEELGALVLAGPKSRTGAGPAGATFQVGTALQPFSIDAIEMVQVSTSLFSAEYGSGSGGIVNVVTKSGTDVYLGSVATQYQSDDYVREAPQKIDRYLGSFSLGGPLVRGKTHFFASVERDDHELGYNFGQGRFIVGPFLQNLGLTANRTERNRVTAKLTHNARPRESFTITLNYSDESADVLDSAFRPSIEDLVREDHQNESIGLVGRDVTLFRSDAMLESLAGFTNVDRTFHSDAEGITEHRNVNGPLGFELHRSGPGSPDSTNRLRSLFWSEKLSWQTATGTWKSGIGLDRFSQNTQQEAWVNHAYFFAATPQFGGVVPAAHLSPSVTESFAFVQHDWYRGEHTTVNAGVRTGYDDLVHNLTFEPRLGIAWDPRGDARSVLRAGVGIYHDRSNLIGHTGADRPPYFEGPIDPETNEIIFGPTGEIVVDPALDLPRSTKWSLGYERQLPFALVAGVALHGSRNRGLFYTERLNRRANDAAGTRPDPTRGDIEFYTNAGESDVYELEVELRRSFSRGALLQFSYNYQDAEGNSTFEFGAWQGTAADGLTWSEDAPRRSQVHGPLDSEIRHSAKLSGVAELPWGIMVSSIAHWRTGRPFSVYHIFANPQRGAILPEGYNSRRLDNYYNVDMRLAKAFSVRGRSVRLSIDVFNVTDRRNVLGRVGTEKSNLSGPIGAPGTEENRSFLRVTGRSAARTGQVGVRFLF